MGFDRNTVNFLIGEKRRGLSLGKTLTLGRQSIYMEPVAYEAALASLGQTNRTAGYCDELLAGLGSAEIHVMDASNYEGASIIQDLNNEAPESLRRSFDCVIDGGTLEHVFNFPVALASCMDMVKQDGVLILISPWHNYAGHGLYQLSPELFYAALSDPNGYSIERMLITVGNRWYRVLEPAAIKSRVEIETRSPVLLHITARRKEIKPIFSRWPQQCDYLAAWSQAVGDDLPNTPERESRLKESLLQRVPPLLQLRSKWRQFKRRCHLSPDRNPGLRLIRDDAGIPLGD